jgi:hypothetical protein
MIFEDFCTPETLRLTIFRPSHLEGELLRLAYP